MARNARLRLAEDGDQLADRQLGLGEQGEEAQARGFARGFERVEQGVEAEGGSGEILDIKICLYVERGDDKGGAMGAE